MLFSTNGSWANREQMRNPAAIQLFMTDPSLIPGGASIPFADLIVEY